MRVPEWLPSGRVMMIPDRGEVFVRLQEHADPQAPAVMLLHGWTASSDTQFLYAYRQLAEHFTVVGVDHHGHGRGLRTNEPFDLDRVAEDVAAVIRALDLGSVITVGYSMGGAVSMHLVRRHPGLVRGMVLQATALEWQSSRFERVRWRFVPLLAPVTRAWWFSRTLGRGLRVVVRHNRDITPLVPWLAGEILRNDPITVVSAGKALSRFDSRPWASSVGVPTASVITTRDRLVRPRKQRALANAVSARIFELRSGHLGALSHPTEFSQATSDAVSAVALRTAEQRR